MFNSKLHMKLFTRYMRFEVRLDLLHIFVWKNHKMIDHVEKAISENRIKLHVCPSVPTDQSISFEAIAYLCKCQSTVTDHLKWSIPCIPLGGRWARLSRKKLTSWRHQSQKTCGLRRIFSSGWILSITSDKQYANDTYGINRTFSTKMKNKYDFDEDLVLETCENFKLLPKSY